MDVVALVVGVVLGALVGLLAGWLLGRRGEAQAQALLAVAEAESKDKAARLVEVTGLLEAERLAHTELQVATARDRAEHEARDTAWQEKVEHYQEIEKNLKDSFQTLSSEVLKGSTEQLLKTAEEVLKQHKERAEGDLHLRHKAIESLVGPLTEKLSELEDLNQHLDRRRVEDHTSLKDMLGRLDKGTGQLITALQGSGSSGRFGEMTLANLFSMAGLLEGTDYVAQATVETGSGKGRPDFIVRLPGGTEMVIDAKAPVQDFELLEDEGADMDARSTDLAKKLLGYAKDLESRDYAGREDAPDFVVMFIASESTYRLAIKGDSDLVGRALERNVLITSPTNLLGLLKVVQFGWRQERLALEARNIQQIGKDLYDAVCTLNRHYISLGTKLGQAVDEYNNFGGSLERTVLPKARKMKESGIQGKADIPESALVERQIRALASAELRPKGRKAAEPEEAADGSGQSGLLL